MNDNKFLWFLIFVIISSTFCWLIGSFITFDLLWFLNSPIARLFASIIFIVILVSSAKAVDEYI